MIRLLLVTYSEQERKELASVLEHAQKVVMAKGCPNQWSDTRTCHECCMRHICTDLLNAAVFAADYKEQPK